MIFFRNSSANSVSTIAKLNTSVYFAPSGAVRSTRLSELRVSFLIGVDTNETKDYYSGIDICNARLKDTSREEEIQELVRIAESMDGARASGGTVLVHGLDLSSVALICMAHLVATGAMAEDGAIDFVQSKRTDFARTANRTAIRRLLADFRAAYFDPGRIKGKSRKKTMVARAGDRVVRGLKRLLRNWFAISLFLIVMAAALRVAALNGYVIKLKY